VVGVLEMLVQPMPIRVRRMSRRYGVSRRKPVKRRTPPRPAGFAEFGSVIARRFRLHARLCPALTAAYISRRACCRCALPSFLETADGAVAPRASQPERSIWMDDQGNSSGNADLALSVDERAVAVVVKRLAGRLSAPASTSPGGPLQGALAVPLSHEG
jgi:hypothetical protein